MYILGGHNRQHYDILSTQKPHTIHFLLAYDCIRKYLQEIRPPSDLHVHSIGLAYGVDDYEQLGDVCRVTNLLMCKCIQEC